MIERYSLPEMTEVWGPQSRFRYLLTVEKAVAWAQGELRIIPKKAALDIQKKAKFNIANILEIEKTTKHDVIAFVQDVASRVGENGKYVHFGLTSSDALDTALSLQFRDAGEIINDKIDKFKKALKAKIKSHKNTLCAGRTHGMHGEPTSFGVKLAGFLAELQRNEVRFNNALNQACRVKLSGAVGTYSFLSMDFEKKVSRKLEMPVEEVATQVIPRDRHSELMFSLSMLMNGIERLAVEIRHLQRTEVGEAEEGFSKGQKGSSAMPHKRNPIASENLTGLSRLVRGYLFSSLENIPLWHERDISHSSVERVIFPDAFIVVDYALNRMAQVISGLEVYPSRMAANMQMNQGQIFSSHVLLALIQKGMSRDEAYQLVQAHSHSLKKGKTLEASLNSDLNVKKLLTKSEIKKIFSGDSHRKNFNEIIKRVLHD